MGCWRRGWDYRFWPSFENKGIFFYSACFRGCCLWRWGWDYCPYRILFFYWI